MDSLIAKLESAEEGDRELDAEIEKAIPATDEWMGRRPASLYEQRAYKTMINSDVAGPLDEYEPPHYTTSLDAKLPGENIECVKRVRMIIGENEYLWEAEHWCNEKTQCFKGIAHTEPLARRIAALKARESEEA